MSNLAGNNKIKKDIPKNNNVAVVNGLKINCTYQMGVSGFALRVPTSEQQ